MTKLVTLTLTPNAAPRTVVTGNLTVQHHSARQARPATNVSTEAVFPYTYTVGPPAP